VVITASPGDEDAYTSALAQLSSILPYGELYEGMKIELSASEMKCRYILSGHPKPANEGHLKTGQRE
jgi:hypothetical protein